MNRLFLIFSLLAVIFVAGCSSDIVTTEDFKTVKYKCFYIEPFKTDNAYVGKVVGDVIEKEFVRRDLAICDRASATVIVTGSTFMTVRAAPTAKELRSNPSGAANQAIDSISVRVFSKDGRVLAIGSYDNKQQYTVGTAAKAFGVKLARKLK